jgi:hypothetical protein
MPHPPEKYVGSYEHEAYGKAAVSVENGELKLNFNAHLVWPLEYCFGNVFKSEFSGVPRVCPKISKTIEKYPDPSKSERL